MKGGATQEGVACATVEVGCDGAGEEEVRPVLPASLKMPVKRIVLPIAGENEASRLADRYAVGEDHVTSSAYASRIIGKSLSSLV
jgi:hypothetical protein